MNQELTQTIAVTGARGYFGGYLCGKLKSAGWDVLALSSAQEIDGVAWDLRSAVSQKERLKHLFQARSVRVLIHAGYDFSAVTEQEIQRSNVEGSIALIQAALEGGVPRVIYISSLSAHEDCRSLYGQGKRKVERHFAGDRRVVSVRPGLIYSRDPRGIFGKMQGFIEKMPVIPVIAGDQEQYLSNIEDLAGFVEGLITEKEIGSSVVPAAHPEPMKFIEILRRIAKARGKKPIFMRVPWRLVWLLLKSMETLGIGLSFKSDSVRSLANQGGGHAISEATGARFRSFKAGDLGD